MIVALDAAAILRAAGLVPAVPSVSPEVGTRKAPENKAVPTVPTVPAKNAKVQGEGSDVAAIRAHLLELAEDECLPAALVHGLDGADLRAIPADYTERNLRAYLRALDARLSMDAGMVPAEWGTPVARVCEGCGPVLLWSDCPPVVKACPWCFRRKAGKPVARPRESLVARWAQEDADNTSGPPYFLPKERGQ